MNRAPYWMLIIVLIALAARLSAAGCAGATQKLRLRLRTTPNEVAGEETGEQQLDLSQLSESQLQQLMQQLNLADEYEEDHRGSSRPWNKVQRIIRRQLVRIPKRYLKKLLRQFGLARAGNYRSGSLQWEPEVEAQPELYYLIPLE
ncbi:uncharacterized protein LOC135441116 [Drosophila montana]|uniref:uncharacterized protein LOC135441116 n=1 Tax=Drosophila montana TaxID=40370 RepID=UPI00313CAEFA